MNAFVWLVRRELWESRAVWVGPAICAAIIVVGLLIASLSHGGIVFDTDHGPKLAEFEAKLTPAKVEALASIVLGLISLPFLITILFVQFFYSIDALYGERRDRSILFWKSLPISDAASVLAKLSVAAVLIPMVACGFAVLTQVLVFALLSVKLSSFAALAGHFWSPVTWAGSLLVMLYVLVGTVLWYLPLVGWLLLVSAWAPRSPFMWATLPPPALALAEWVVFRTNHLWHVIGGRVGNIGFLSEAFAKMNGEGFGFGYNGPGLGEVTAPASLVDLMQPGVLFTSTSLWAGVVVGGALVATTIWMRRYRDESN